MGQGKKPDRKMLAQWKVSHDLGNSNNAIGKTYGVSHHTVKKYLTSDAYDDPQIAAIVERIKEAELRDLTVIGAKARANLHNVLDSMTPDNLRPGTMAAAKWARASAIPITAILDRGFQQRRILEGKGAEGISNLTAIIQAAHALGKNGKEVMELKVSVQTGVKDSGAGAEQAIDVTPGQ